MGRDTKRVEKVVKEVFGGKTKVYKGGSQLKRTNVRSSDNDLKIEVPYMLTWADKETLGIALDEEFGIRNVDKSHSKIHVVRGESGYIDIVPNTLSNSCFHVSSSTIYFYLLILTATPTTQS